LPDYSEAQQRLFALLIFWSPVPLVA
jgi:hypothetical protein